MSKFGWILLGLSVVNLLYISQIRKAMKIYHGGA